MTAQTFKNRIDNAKTNNDIIEIYKEEIITSARLICADDDFAKINCIHIDNDIYNIDILKIEFEYQTFYNSALISSKNNDTITIEDLADLINSIKYNLHSIIINNKNNYTFYDCVNDKSKNHSYNEPKLKIFKYLSNSVKNNIDNLYKEERERRRFDITTNTNLLGYELDTIHNMDCMVGMKKMGDNCVDFVMTDIPYDSVNKLDNKNKGIRQISKGDADIITFNLDEFLAEIYRVCSNSFCIFCGFSQISTIIKFFNKHNCTTRILVQEKSNPSPINCDIVYTSNIEVAVWAKKKNNGVFNAFYKGTVFRYNVETSCSWHPTPKNIEMIKEIISDNTNEGMVVFDPCMGSGSTAKACLGINRHFLGFELSEKFFALLKTDLDKIMYPGMY